MDSKNFALGILSTTASVLLVGLLVIHTRPAPVLASGMTTTAGNYVMTVGRDVTADEDYVYLLHKPSARLIVYRFDSNRQQIDGVQGSSLADLRAASGQGGRPGQPISQPTQRRGRRP